MKALEFKKSYVTVLVVKNLTWIRGIFQISQELSTRGLKMPITQNGRPMNKLGS